MTPTNIEHAVFETIRHGDGGDEVQIVGPFGTLGIAVPAPGHAEHLDAIDLEGEIPSQPEKQIPAGARFA